MFHKVYRPSQLQEQRTANAVNILVYVSLGITSLDTPSIENLVDVDDLFPRELYNI